MAGSGFSVFNSSILQGVRSYLPSTRTGDTDEEGLPKTHEDWVERYDTLERAYIGLRYKLKLVRKLKLFRAVDPTGQTIAITRRITRDVAHVVDTDARAMANGLRLVRSSDDVEDDVLSQGQAIWKRSKVSAGATRWARLCAGLGDVMMEAVRLDGKAPYDVHIVGYDPRFVQLEYDIATATRIMKATVTIPYNSSPEEQDDLSNVGASEQRVYKRVLTPTSVTVYIDGEVQEEMSGDHGLGVVPLVHVPYTPWTDPAHGLWAAEGLEEALAMVNSLLTQMLAVGIRYASPLWVARGFRLASGADLNFGRVLGIPQDSSFTPVEPSLSGLATLLAAAESTRQLSRETLPEFLFTDAGSSASGTALGFRATAFVAKAEEVNSTRWFPALTTVTEYARAMEDDRPYDPDDSAFAIQAPPVLPVDTTAFVDVLVKVKDNGGLLQRDFVAHLQALDIVPDEDDPDEYAAKVLAEQQVRANMEAEALAGLAGQIEGFTNPEVAGDADVAAGVDAAVADLNPDSEVPGT